MKLVKELIDHIEKQTSSNLEHVKDLIEKVKHEVSTTDKDYRELIDAIPCTISWIDRDKKYKAVNKFLAEQCGIPKEDFTGKEVGFYTKNMEFKEWIDNFLNSAENFKKMEHVTEINGKKKYFWVSGQKFGPNNESVIIGLDITAQRLAEKALSTQETVKNGEIAVSALIHEISNPLTSINLRVERLLRTIDDPAQVQKNGEAIQSVVQRIMGILEEVRNTTRGKEVSFHEVNLAQILTEVQDTFEDRLYGMQIDLKIHNDFNEIFVKGSSNQLFEVFANLVSNARDAVSELENKWIKIDVTRDNKDIVIEVIDAGPGIPEEIRAKLFMPFYTTKTDSKGTGLGLTIIEKIIRNHGGAFSLDSTKENTCFRVQLPLLKVPK